MEIIVKSADLQKSARYFWEQMKNDERLFAFHGEMGIGKTSFIAALCKAKGVTEPVTSPTFSLINEYRYTENGAPKRIFHIDLYRLKDEEEAIRAGIEDCFYSNDLCFVEWPEKTPGLLPSNRVDIYMYPVNNQTRLLKMEFHR